MHLLMKNWAHLRQTQIPKNNLNLHHPFPLIFFRIIHLYFFELPHFKNIQRISWIKIPSLEKRHFGGPHPQHVEVPGCQGWDLCHSSNLSHCSDNARSLTRCTTRELQDIFGGPCPQHVKTPDQGLNPHPSRNQSRRSEKSTSLTHRATRERQEKTFLVY